MQLKALPLRPLIKRRREEGKKRERMKKNGSRGDCLPEATGDLSINPMAGLCWNGSMSCPAVGRVIITIIYDIFSDGVCENCVVCGVHLFCTEGRGHG